MPGAPPVIKIDPADPDEGSIRKVVEILKSGGVIAYPTETFYGLGADAANEAGVDRIFSVKGRDFRKPIPLIAGSERDIENLVADLPQAARMLMERFWPGPLTILFAAAPSLNARLTGGTGKIGARVSSHPVAARLAQSMGGAITSTSANLSGQEECVTAGEAVERLGLRIDLVIDGGPSPGGKGSTIVDVTVDPVRIIREGVVPERIIRHTL